MRYSPAQIIAIESFREDPFCSIMGCCETESVAQKVVAWLATSGNDWALPLPQLTQFGTAWELDHGHSGEDGSCDFARDYTIDGYVNEYFVTVMHRRMDGMRWRADILHQLRPDLFPRA